MNKKTISLFSIIAFVNLLFPSNANAIISKNNYKQSSKYGYNLIQSRLENTQQKLDLYDYERTRIRRKISCELTSNTTGIQTSSSTTIPKIINPMFLTNNNCNKPKQV